jgi:hypothetical protein
MATNPIIDSIVAEAVDEAVGDLVQVKSWGDYTFVNLPLILPDGSDATVRVKRIDGGFQVDDAGFTYRDLARAGADRSFYKNAVKYAERKELTVDGKMIFVHVDADDLRRAICDVGAVSWQVLDRVYARLNGSGEVTRHPTRPRIAPDPVGGAN